MLEEDKQFFESLGIKFDGDWGEYSYFACSEGILIANTLEASEIAIIDQLVKAPTCFGLE